MNRWLFLAALLAPPVRAAVLEVSPREAATGVDGVLHFTALFDPDGPGPQPVVDVTTSAAFNAAGPVQLQRTVFDGVLALGVAAGPGTVAVSYAGFEAEAAVRVAGRVHREVFSHGGRLRVFQYYLPDGLPASRPAPVVLALHGGGGDGPAMEALTNFDTLAAERGFIAVYPDAVDKHWNDGRGIADYVSHQENIDDVGFLAEVLRRVAQAAAVDAERVYIAGISNGSLMAKRLACERSDLLAAVGAVASTLPRGIADGCRFDHPIPMLYIHGLADAHTPFEGGDMAGGDTLSVPELMALWRGKNGCAGAAYSWDLPDPVNDGTRARAESAGCAEERRVPLYLVEGAGHTWPGGLQYFPEENLSPVLAIGKTSRDFWASREIWEFFATKRRSAGVPPAAPDPARAYPVPFNPSGGGPLVLDRMPANARVRVYTASGGLVLDAAADSTGQLLWDGRNQEGRAVAGGVYVIQVSGGSGERRFKIAVTR